MNYKSRLLALWLLASSFACSCTNYVLEREPRIIDVDDSLEYSKGKIYIGDDAYLSSLENVEENDILVLDERKEYDPNMKIYDSYKINNIDDLEEILNVLLNYEKNNPSDWNRTLKSMRNEWLYHNVLYFINYQRDRTKDVDLNNVDEKTYVKAIISK